MTALKEAAWNGIRLNVPSTWRIYRIGIRHLIFEDGEHPTMEIKWAPVKGHFSHRKHLKRLASQHGYRLNKELQTWRLPTGWEKALSSYKAEGFSWQTDTDCGHGAILFCPSCRNATLIQFLGAKTMPADHIMEKILQTFDDHTDEAFVLWAVFDIRASLPHRFKLISFQFKPGNFELIFSDGAQNIRLFRWAPASLLLQNIDLQQFAENTMSIDKKRLSLNAVHGHEGIEWKLRPASGWRQLSYGFKTRPGFHWGRLWIEKNNNRILGVKIDSKRPLDPGIMETIYSQYETV